MLCHGLLDPDRTQIFSFGGCMTHQEETWFHFPQRRPDREPSAERLPDYFRIVDHSPRTSCFAFNDNPLQQ
jgi:hypothetical protein